MSRIKIGNSLQTRMLLSYFLIIAMIIIVSMGALHHVKHVYITGNDIYENNLLTKDYLKTLNINLRQMDKHIVCILEDIGDTSVEDNINTIETIMKDNADIMNEYEQLKFGELEKKKYNECRLSIVRFNKDVNHILELLRGGEFESAKSFYEQDLLPVETTTYKLLDEVAELSDKNADKNNEINFGSYKKIIWLIVITMVLTVIIAVIVSLKMSSSINDKLSVIKRWAKRISEYNVSEDIKDVSDDEFGATTKALNDSQFMIRDLVEKIMEESALITDTGKEVSAAVRKSKHRMEVMSLKIHESDKQELEFINQIKETMLISGMSPELVDKLKELLSLVENNSVSLDMFSEELTNMATYMEQIAITSDYQNKMAEEHREQVGKFKV